MGFGNPFSRAPAPASAVNANNNNAFSQNKLNKYKGELNAALGGIANQHVKMYAQQLKNKAVLKARGEWTTSHEANLKKSEAATENSTMNAPPGTQVNQSAANAARGAASAVANAAANEAIRAAQQASQNPGTSNANAARAAANAAAAAAVNDLISSFSSKTNKNNIGSYLQDNRYKRATTNNQNRITKAAAERIMKLAEEGGYQT